MMQSLFYILVLLFLATQTHASEWIDLTHPFDEHTIYWPTADGFKIERRGGQTDKGFYYAANIFCTPEHGGTHVDAPLHFAAGKRTVDLIPLDDLKGMALIVDFSTLIANQADYLISSADLMKWEAENESIREGDIVIIKTGWARFWPDKKKYLGSDVKGDVDNLHFPGLSEKAAQYLVTKKIKALGVDTASLDTGGSQLFPVHRVLLSKNIYGIENLANLDAVKSRRFFVIVAPMKIAGGTGGPARIFALPQIKTPF